MIQHCDFYRAEQKNGKQVYRCENTGCTNAVYSEDGKIGPVKCKSKINGEAITRAMEACPCRCRGELTGTSVEGCGCHVPAWQKQLYKCALHGSCVLLKLKKRSGQTNCEGCESRPQ